MKARSNNHMRTDLCQHVYTWIAHQYLPMPQLSAQMDCQNPAKRDLNSEVHDTLLPLMCPARRASDSLTGSVTTHKSSAVAEGFAHISCNICGRLLALEANSSLGQTQLRCFFANGSGRSSAFLTPIAVSRHAVGLTTPCGANAFSDLVIVFR